MGRSGLVVLSTVALATLALAAAPLRAGTLNVPGDSPTIQGAIAMASNGDTILVAPGTYVEMINDLGKPLVIESTGGAAVTTIDAAGGGTVVTLSAVGPADTELRGFTITGGTGTELGGSAGGGGVIVGNSVHASLSDCVISGNTVAGTDFYQLGGGVMLGGTTSTTLTDCILSGNSAKFGGAVVAYNTSASLHMSGCTVVGNTSQYAAVFTFGVGTIESCAFVDNVGNGLHYTGYGLTTKDCVFSGNTGWGLTHYGDVGSHIAGCSFLGNGLGGAHLLEPKYANGWHSATHCIFANGDAMDAGTVFYVDLYNSTFADAHVTTSYSHCEITARDTIFRGAGGLVIGDYATLAVEYCDIEGGMAGTGNIDADPLWVDAGSNDYRLLPASPCIDAGSPSSPLDPDGTRADMGAIAFENAFDDLGGGVSGSAGPVVLASHSTLLGGEGVYFKLTGTPPSQPVVLILGATQLGAPFKGGTLWPNPSVLINLFTNGAGQLTLNTTWPAAIPSGFSLWAQGWFPNAGAIAGFAGSNGVRGTVP